MMQTEKSETYDMQEIWYTYIIVDKCKTWEN